MFDASTVLKILNALFAILVGSIGVIAIFYGLNLLVERFLKRWRQQLLPWVYMGPAILLLSAYLILPTIWTIYISFLDGRSESFVGLKNYVFAVTNGEMLIAFRNNLLWLILVTSISVGFGLVTAVLFDRVRYEAIVKSLLFLPMAISFVSASVIWRFIYAFRPAGNDQIGLLNALVTALGSSPIGWLVNRNLNNFALMAIMIWLYTGFCMVLLSSAIKGIPHTVIEAARIDGANEIQIFLRVIVPMIRPTITVVTTALIVFVLKIFDIVFVMTGGNLDTDVIASRMIKEMFIYRHFGRGSAIAVILLLAVIPVMVGNIFRLRQQEKNT